MDSCYSFWQGALFPLIDLIENGIQFNEMNDQNNNKNREEKLEDGSWLFRQQSLQEYILICCQDRDGGLRDKPGKTRDLYHTCYSLSGLSISQHNKNSPPTILGNPNNLLVRKKFFFQYHKRIFILLVFKRNLFIQSIISIQIKLIKHTNIF